MGRTRPVKGWTLTAATQVKNDRGVLPLYCRKTKDNHWVELVKSGEPRYDETFQIAAKLWIENHTPCPIVQGNFGLLENQASRVLLETG